MFAFVEEEMEGERVASASVLDGGILDAGNIRNQEASMAEMPLERRQESGKLRKASINVVGID